MKKMLMALSLLALSTAVFAKPIVTGVTQSIYPTHPTVTTFEFTEHSCRKFHPEEFVVNVEEKTLGLSSEVVKFVKVEMAGPAIDCMGPTRSYKYKISTDEIKVDDKYILNNPSVLKINKVVNVTPPRFCTQAIEVLIHPETKECVAARNGCVGADYRRRGFVFAELNECTQYR